MKGAIIAAALCATVGIATAAEETKLGTGVSLKSATPIAEITANPEAYVGRTIRIDGIATAVCEHMGCWMAVAPEGSADGKTVRLKVEDGVIVFPVSAKGKKVSAEGLFEEVGAGDPDAHEAAGEHARKDAAASKTYQLKATGAVIR